MDALVTIAEFEFPSDLLVARGRLESEGIECYLKDELTVQVHNLLSHAVGGVKLQVEAHEAERATAMLREWGFLPTVETVDLRKWIALDEWTRKIPLIGRIDLLIARLTAMGALALAMVIPPLVIVMQPSMEERLVTNRWCIDQMFYDGAEISPASNWPSVFWSGCEESLFFSSEGKVYLPGFNTPKIEVQWSVDHGQLWFTFTEPSTQVFYEGPFTVSVNEQKLVLRSMRTTIFCSKLHSYW